jgi:lactoylglutathione lyase
MKFDHGAFQISDMDAAIAFYTGKLGFTLDFRGENADERELYAFVSLGEARIELIQDLTQPFAKPEVRKPYCPHFCIEVPNMDAAVASLKAAGIPIVRGPLEIKGEETWVYFADPDNNVLEYIQWYKAK